jgi:hypothetical protein
LSRLCAKGPLYWFTRSKSLVSIRKSRRLAKFPEGVLGFGLPEFFSDE